MTSKWNDHINFDHVLLYNGQELVKSRLWSQINCELPRYKLMEQNPIPMNLTPFFSHLLRLTQTWLTQTPPNSN